MATIIIRGWNTTHSWRIGFGRGVVYLYLLRFSLLLWFTPLLLMLLDKFVLKTFTEGIFNVEYQQQILCNTFFLVASGIFALINARLVALNGEERFGSEPPIWIEKFLGKNSQKNAALALVVTLLPALITVVCLALRACAQGIFPGQVVLGVFWGLLISCLFWIGVNAFYVWTYNPAIYPPTNGKPPEVKTLLLPNSWKWLAFSALHQNHKGPQPDMVQNLVLRGFDWLARNLGPGYSERVDVRRKPLPPNRSNWPLWEGHCLSFFAFGGMALLYFVMFPLTAPLKLAGNSLASLIGISALTAVIIISLWAGINTDGGTQTFAELGYRVTLTLLSAFFIATLWYLYIASDAERFPTLSFVLILLIWTGTAACSFSFFFDRYRVPVGSVVLLLVVVNLCGWPLLKPRGADDRYYTAVKPTPSSTAKVPSPRDILVYKVAHHPGEPLIVITATGGGLHAAAWTAEMLGQLETQFDQKLGENWFRQHVLVISTVSGGSVGLLSYLEELSINQSFTASEDAIDRMRASSYCSSLEAAAWGLTYPDFLHMLTGVTPTSSGSENEGPGMFRDRTWALGQAFQRNLTNQYCAATVLPSLKKGFTPQNWSSYPRLSLLTTVPKISGSATDQPADTNDDSSYPAYTMNTTAMETGARFLLANYQIPQPPFHDSSATDGPSEIVFRPAESFLHVYGPQPQPETGQKGFADLPLYSAALLSATFPYVSNVTRLPLDYSNHAHHFGDGGYYDNDGVGSALEFLCFALDESPCAQKAASATQPKPEEYSAGQRQRRKPAHKLKPPAKPAEPAPVHSAPPGILFVEIRDADDLPSTNPDSFMSQQPQEKKELEKAPRYPLFQPVAPPLAFWLAGHESTTLRNQRELAVAVPAFGLDKRFYHLVLAFNDACASSKLDDSHPLSWSLTPKQRQQIYDRATNTGCSVQKKIKAVINWTAAGLVSPLARN